MTRLHAPKLIDDAPTPLGRAAHAPAARPRPLTAPLPRRSLAGRLLAPRAGGMSVAARGYIALVFSGWLGAMLYAALNLSAGDARRLLPVLVLTALVQRFGLELYARGTSVTLGAVGNLAAGMLIGVPGVLITSSLAMLCNPVARRSRPAMLFNLGAIGLSNAAAALAFIGLDRVIPGTMPLAQLPGALAAGAVAYLGECVFMTLIVALTTNRSPRRVWADNYQWLLPHWLGLGLLALGLAATYRATGLVGLLAFVGPAALMRYGMKQYLDRTTRSVQELSARNEELEETNAKISQLTATLRQTYSATLEALVGALDARDRETYGHSTRVAELTKVLAREMGVPEDSQEWLDIERGALLHDVGKIGVADAILRKPGALSDAEWVDMRRHAQIGYDVVKDVPFLAGAAEIIAAHHERWDGKGYPRGLAGEEIPLGARMFMLADTFDAMATDRPYRRARPYAEILAEIERCAGTQFDPESVAALQAVFPRWVQIHRDSLARAGVTRLAEVA